LIQMQTELTWTIWTIKILLLLVLDKSDRALLVSSRRVIPIPKKPRPDVCALYESRGNGCLEHENFSCFNPHIKTLTLSKSWGEKNGGLTTGWPEGLLASGFSVSELPTVTQSEIAIVARPRPLNLIQDVAMGLRLLLGRRSGR